VLDCWRLCRRCTGLSSADFLQPGVVVQLGDPPLRIDILTSIDGVEFVDAYPMRLLDDVDGLAVSFIGRDELLANKRASGRAQDIADVTR
jgi:hypothetical protein